MDNNPVLNLLNEDLVTALEAARVALQNKDVFDHIGDALDLSPDELERIRNRLQAALAPKELPDRVIKDVQCIEIEAFDWVERPEVLQWLMASSNDVMRTSHLDFVTIYDNGDGPHCPYGENDLFAMPEWLWEEIEKIMADRKDRYAVIRFMNLNMKEG